MRKRLDRHKSLWHCCGCEKIAEMFFDIIPRATAAGLVTGCGRRGQSGPDEMIAKDRGLYLVKQEWDEPERIEPIWTAVWGKLLYNASFERGFDGNGRYTISCVKKCNSPLLHHPSPMPQLWLDYPSGAWERQSSPARARASRTEREQWTKSGRKGQNGKRRFAFSRLFPPFAGSIFVLHGADGVPVRFRSLPSAFARFRSLGCGEFFLGGGSGHWTKGVFLNMSGAAASL